jgi:AraC family transcriptional regulator of adaptative response / DNA-3-methyladenine glycosylase II
MGTSTTVKRALRLISEGALDSGSIQDLGDRLGVTRRHLSRLFSRHLGTSPKSVAQTRRLHFAKKLLDETNLTIIEIALSSGYRSVRRFNDHFKNVYGRAPNSLRKKARDKSGKETKSGFELKLAYRPPFDFEGILRFLALRAIPGVEQVDDAHTRYSRTIQVGYQPGRLTVTDNSEHRCLQVYIETDEAHQLMTVLEKVNRLFDLTADPIEIMTSFKNDKILSGLAQQNPGQRVPGCWDPFELAVRAVVGQQISVKGATTVMGRIAKEHGTETCMGLCFPLPVKLARLDPGSLPMPRQRAMAIKDMSTAVIQGKIDLSTKNTTDNLQAQLTSIKGIGPWTAQYIAMRALNDPDVFLHNDLVLLKVAKQKLKIDNDKALLKRSYSWQPWRAYAGMHLWRQASELK